MTTLSELFKLSDTPILVDGSIDEVKLDTSVNTSLDLADSSLQTQQETVVFILSPEGVDIAVDTDILGLNAFPYTMTITSVRCDIGTAPTGSTVIVDMLKNGTTIMTDKFSIDATEFSSTTAAVPPVLSSTSIALGDKISFKIDQIGATIKGQYLTITLNGDRA